MAATDNHPTGLHSRRSYIALVFGLQQARRTGILEVRSARHWRRLYVVDGIPGWWASDRIDDELARSLVQHGLIPERDMQQIRRKLGPYDRLGTALVDSGRLDASGLAAHRLSQVESGVGAPVGWDRGDWTFEEHDDLPLATLDPSLLPEVTPLRGLWSAVRHFVPMDEALPDVVDQEAGAVRAGPGLDRFLPMLGLSDPLDSFGEVLGKGVEIDELFKKIPDRSGHLVLLVWFLQTAGLVLREDSAMDPGLVKLAEGTDLSGASSLLGPGHGAAEHDTTQARGSEATAGAAKPSTAAKRPGKAPRVATSETGGGKRRAVAVEGTFVHQDRRAGKAEAEVSEEVERLARLIRTAHRHRMSHDFYSFLDLRPTASPADILDAYERLTRGWQAAGAHPGLRDGERRLIVELSAAALLAWQTLSDDPQREEYDKLLAKGIAPTFQSPEDRGELPSVPSGQEGELGPEHVEVRRLMDRGEFRQALQLLEGLREAAPSSAELLADLGWCAWRARYMGSGEGDGPEDYLLLAHTFDPECGRALEFLARMAKERGDEKALKTWAKRLLKASPNHAWARTVLTKGAGGKGAGK